MYLISSFFGTPVLGLRGYRRLLHARTDIKLLSAREFSGVKKSFYL